jgi:hypothetical protein
MAKQTEADKARAKFEKARETERKAVAAREAAEAELWPHIAPENVKAKAQASSSYTDQNITDRLKALEGKKDAESKREREYLEGLRAKRNAKG